VPATNFFAAFPSNVIIPLVYSKGFVKADTTAYWQTAHRNQALFFGFMHFGVASSADRTLQQLQ